MAAESGRIRLGTKGKQTSTYIAGISGVAVAGGVGVIVDSNGHLGTVVSSARFKDEIQPMDKASEAILALKPVTFRYKHELDPDGIPQFGLVAEQVEKVNPDLVARDEQGKPYTVRYEAVNAMLLNEFLKAHRKVEDRLRSNRSRRNTKGFEAQLAASALKAQAAQIQKVNDQLETASCSSCGGERLSSVKRPVDSGMRNQPSRLARAGFLFAPSEELFAARFVSTRLESTIVNMRLE